MYRSPQRASRRPAFGFALPLLAPLLVLTAAVVGTGAVGATILTAAAQAQETRSGAIVSVIERQLEAFAAGDPAAAFAQAAPTIRKRFGDGAAFMRMVRRGYAPLIAPRARRFAELRRIDETRFVQEMTLVGRDGAGYIAHYAMERQPDGSYRIAGCRLEKLPGGSV